MRKNNQSADRSKTEAAHPPGEGVNQSIIVVSSEELRLLKTELLEAIDERLERACSSKSDEILSLSEAQELLHLSPKQFFNLRRDKLIKYSKVGRKIYVKRRDLDEYINNHIIN